LAQLFAWQLLYCHWYSSPYTTWHCCSSAQYLTVKHSCLLSTIAYHNWLHLGDTIPLDDLACPTFWSLHLVNKPVWFTIICCHLLWPQQFNINLSHSNSTTSSLMLQMVYLQAQGCFIHLYLQSMRELLHKQLGLQCNKDWSPSLASCNAGKPDQLLSPLSSSIHLLSSHSSLFSRVLLSWLSHQASCTCLMESSYHLTLISILIHILKSILYWLIPTGHEHHLMESPFTNPHIFMLICSLESIFIHSCLLAGTVQYLLGILAPLQHHKRPLTAFLWTLDWLLLHNTNTTLELGMPYGTPLD